MGYYGFVSTNIIGFHDSSNQWLDCFADITIIRAKRLSPLHILFICKTEYFDILGAVIHVFVYRTNENPRLKE